MIKAIHYTITKQTEKGLKEVMISKCNEGWIVEDGMGDITGDGSRLLGTFKKMEDSIRFAIQKVNKKFPKGIWVTGEGFPPKWERYRK